MALKVLPHKSTSIMVFKTMLWISAFLTVVYGLLMIFAPSQLQQLRASLQDERGGKELHIGTASKEGHYYRIGALLRDFMVDDKGRDLEVETTQGSLTNASMLRRGQLDMALIQGGLPGEYLEGLSALANVGWQYIHVVVRKDSGFQDIRDLAEAHVSFGPEGSGSASVGRKIVSWYWPNGGPTIDYLRVADLDASLRSGAVDALILAYDYHAPFMEDLLADGEMRLLPIDGAEAFSKSVNGYYPATIPRGTYGPLRRVPSRDIETVRIKTLLVASPKMNAIAVQQTLDVLFSARFINEGNLAGLTEATGQDVNELPLHKAAARFYRRNEPITADKFEIGSAVLALLLFIGSVANFLSNRSRERHTERLRKRIIPHFEDLLQCSEALAKANDEASLRELVDRMMHTQQKAEAEWLKGMLDTEHMENLYAIYGIHCQNAFNKMKRLMEARRLEMLERNS